MANAADFLTLNKAALASMPAEQLFVLLDALITLDDVLAGLISRPGFLNSARTLNGAGQELSGLSDWFTSAKDSVVTAARNRPDPQTKADAKWLGWVHIRNEAQYLDTFTGLNVIVAQAAHAEEEANA